MLHIPTRQAWHRFEQIRKREVPMEQTHAGKLSGAWRAWLILAVGLICAATTYWQGKAMVAREQTAQLDLRASEAVTSIARELGVYAELLRGLQAEFLINPDLSRQTFHQI